MDIEQIIWECRRGGHMLHGINYPEVPDSVSNETIFYDAWRGLTMVATWGDGRQWIFVAHNGNWVSQRPVDARDGFQFVEDIRKE